MANRNLLKTRIEDILRKHPEARNSDTTLTIILWKEYYNKKLYLAKNGRYYLDLDFLYDLPSQDDIKRIRAHFQNDRNLYLPTTWEVAKKRKWKQEVWRELISNTQPNLI